MVTSARNVGHVNIMELPFLINLGGHFLGFLKSRWLVGKKFSIPKQLCRFGLEAKFFLSKSLNLATLYSRKGPRKLATRGIPNVLITPPFYPGYSLQVRVLCVTEQRSGLTMMNYIIVLHQRFYKDSECRKVRKQSTEVKPDL